MSTKGIRDFRPIFHYTPEAGWINDPNGLVFHKGQYHLFAQHYPHEAIWGSMHWAHAVSDDLIHWNRLPIAIYPSDEGQIFSGSAVSDTHNFSGWSSEENPALIAMYTSHGEQETQCIAYSTDSVQFENLENNPVIPNPGLIDFRDPKLFWNSKKQLWSMVLAATDRVHFYSTKDFKEWKKTGEFGPDGNHASGIWECPDLVPLQYNGKTMHMLIVSMTTTPEDGKANTQYFLGEFDGDTFHCTVPFGKMEKIDDGWDNYAGVTFNNLDKPILIGWGANWEYSNALPTNEFCGQMTLARELSLRSTPEGIRLSSVPIGYDAFLSQAKSLKDSDTINSETFCLKINGRGASTIMLSNKENQSLYFGIDNNNQLFFDRSLAGNSQFHASFPLAHYSKKYVKRYFDGSYEMEFIFDVSIAELFIDNGTRFITALVYPDSPYNKILATGDIQITVSDIKV